MSEKTGALYILSNSRRRSLIRVLRELGGVACLREVVRRVAEREGGPDVGRGLVKSVHVSLLQTHIPKMEGAGLIRYDRASDTVELLELSPEYRYYLEAVKKKDIPWSLYYLFLSAFGLAVSWVVDNFLASLICLCVFVAAVGHTVQTFRVFGRVNEWLTGVKRELTKRG